MADIAEAEAPPARSAARLTPAALFKLGAIFAVALALVEILFRLVMLWMRRTPLGAGWDIVWMAPLMNFVWFGGGALLAIVGRRLLPRLFTPAVQLALLTMPGLISLMWLIPKLHSEAALILGIGLAAQAGRMLADRSHGIVRLARSAFVPSIGLAILAVVVVAGVARIREARAMAALPDSPSSRPNVLFLILDTVRSYSTSAYGYGRETTPNLSRLAERGVTFDRTFVPATWTMPSHATLFTGRWPFELRTGPRRPLRDEHPTLAESMASAGYATGGFAANHAYLTWEHGLTRGFIRFEGYPSSPAMFFTSTIIGRMLMEYNTFRKPLGFFDSPKRKSARMVNEQFLDWMEDLDGDRPFFAFLNYFDAHHPYLPPEPYLTKFGAHGDMRWRGHELEFDELSAAEIARKQNQYDGGIAYLDAEIGRLLDRLAADGVLDNTIVVITSDHGEHWGEHERLSHGNSMYRQLLQVPFLMLLPNGDSSGTRIRRSVSLRDLPATILDAAGVRDAGLPGTSLLPLVRGDSSFHGSEVFSEDALFGTIGARSLIADSLHYIRFRDGKEQLYSLEKDSLELTNLAGSSAYAAVLATLRARMNAIVGTAPPPDIVRPEG